MSSEIAGQAVYLQVRQPPSEVRAVLRRLTVIAEARSEA
jgi:hypothetical protein